MKTTHIFRNLLLCVAVVFCSLNLNAGQFDSREANQDYGYVPNELLVQFKGTGRMAIKRNAPGRISSVGNASIDALLLDSIGAIDIEELMPLTGNIVANTPKRVNGRELPISQDLSRLVCVRFDTSRYDIDYIIEILERQDIIETVSLNYLLYAQVLGGGNSNIPSTDAAVYTQEPLYSQQWGIPAINLPYLWNQPKKSTKRPVIAILDTGVDITHPDLAANIWTNNLEGTGVSGQDDDNNGYFDDIHGYDFIKKSVNINDPNGHGTHCAGIAAAVGNNGVGITGANPDALIMPITVLDATGKGDMATLIKGIDYAIANGADILSMSLGTCSSVLLDAAILKAYYANRVIVAAAGNNGRDINDNKNCDQSGLMFPAAFSYVIGVVASDEGNNRAYFSNYDSDGPIYTNYPLESMYNYEVMAPGKDIYSTWPGGQYKSLNGTSMATPLVAGAISRLLQCKEFSSQEMLAGMLVQSSMNPSYGIVNMQRIYAMNENNVQPVLATASYTIDDPLGDNDGKVDAGETIAIYPTIKCVFGNADSIYYNLRVLDISDTSLIQILDNNVSFGASLSSGATMKAKNPIRVHVSEQCGNGYPLRLICDVTCRNASIYTFSQELEIEVQDIEEIYGFFTEDLVLAAGKEYYLTNDLAMADGASLILSPGVTLIFKPNMFVYGNVIARGKPDSLITIRQEVDKPWREGGSGAHINFTDTVCYAVLSGISGKIQYLKNCILHHYTTDYYFYNAWNSNTGECYVHYCENCNSYNKLHHLYPDAEVLVSCNLLNCSVQYYLDKPVVTVLTPSPNYYGATSETIIRDRRWVRDFSNGYSSYSYDLSNRLLAPNPKAHGFLWKVEIDGYNALDEYDIMPALGVGQHTYSVYFNRPMDISTCPSVTFGVRYPYQQHIMPVGTWSADSTMYSGTFLIDAKTSSDGVNRLYVSNAFDNEHFEAYPDSIRFNMQIQAMGSLSTGLMATPGLGKVTLDWQTDEEDFADLLGYNICRWTNDTIRWNDYYTYIDGVKQYVPAGWRIDTVLVNETLINSHEQQFIDYNVIPGKEYYYTIKQVTTSLQSYELSNVVAATPLTAMKGDANGSMSVDVADVITDVNYIGHQNPQPFIFEAADVNSDNTINVLDIVGTINLIIHPQTQSQSINSGTAIYYVENGILYVNSDVVLGGVQFTLAVDSATATITPLDVLAPFEKVNQWNNAEEYFFLAYSMSGKTIGIGETALMQIGDADVTSITFSDPQGHNVAAAPRISTHLDGTKFLPNTEKFINNGSLYVRIGERIYNATGILVK